jgi:hypothetical protein
MSLQIDGARIDSLVESLGLRPEDIERIKLTPHVAKVKLKIYADADLERLDILGLNVADVIHSVEITPKRMTVVRDAEDPTERAEDEYEILWPVTANTIAHDND